MRPIRDFGPERGGPPPLGKRHVPAEGEAAEQVRVRCAPSGRLPVVTSYMLAGIDDPATYLNAGWLSISVPNLLVILLMIILFVLAVVLPFPKDRDNS